MRASALLARATLITFAALATAGCGEIIVRAREEPRPPPPSVVSPPSAALGEGEGGGAEVVVAPPTSLPDAAKRIKVYATKRIEGLTEVVGVIDMHTSATSEDKGFDLLRLRAYQLGADAVIGAEFEHGEGSEPSHLAGMAVRFIQ